MPAMRRSILVPILLLGLDLAACGDDDAENTGEACMVEGDCYEDVADEDRDALGTIECLDRVEGGYCTHLCEGDDDCCVVDGECATDHPQVASPFENESAIQRCFLSCEPEVIGDQEENDYCHEFASDEFECRSTGGGSENRKVCVPPG